MTRYLVGIVIFALWLGLLLIIVPRYGLWVQAQWLRGPFMSRRNPWIVVPLAILMVAVVGAAFGSRGWQNEVAVLGGISALIILMLIVITGVLFLLGMTRFNRGQ